MPYPYKVDLPELVRRAYEHAAEIGFPMMLEGRPIGYEGPPTTIIPEDGALLRTLAASYVEGRIGEIGTGPGVSTAWLVSGMSEGSALLTCDIDDSLADFARGFFKDYPMVSVLSGDWEEVFTNQEPFDLLFFDATPRAYLMDDSNWDDAVQLVRVGGQIVMDDLKPVDMWPQEWEGMTDHKREFIMSNPRVAGAEVRTTTETVSLIGTRIR